jgi:hypothetical protein
MSQQSNELWQLLTHGPDQGREHTHAQPCPVHRMLPKFACGRRPSSKVIMDPCLWLSKLTQMRSRLFQFAYFCGSAESAGAQDCLHAPNFTSSPDSAGPLSERSPPNTTLTKPASATADNRPHFSAQLRTAFTPDIAVLASDCSGTLFQTACLWKHPRDSRPAYVEPCNAAMRVFLARSSRRYFQGNVTREVRPQHFRTLLCTSAAALHAGQ